MAFAWCVVMGESRISEIRAGQYVPVDGGSDKSWKAEFRIQESSESAERYRPSAGSSRNSSRKPPFNFNRSRTEKHLRTSDSKFSAV